MKCAIGLMSGTSMDGIDIAVVNTDGKTRVQRGSSDFIPYEASFRRRLENALTQARMITRHEERPGNLAALEREITLRHAEAVRRFLATHPQLNVELIGFHGQTVLHRPESGLTVQLGDGPLLGQACGLPVVYDMRANDMRHGGQGAPLAPAYHGALAAALPDELRCFPVCFVNIGGISNVTYVPRRGDPVAFDSGPGNSLIDRWVLLKGGVAYDADGRIARQGRVVRPVVERYLENHFFARAAPKSLDRGDFTLDLVAGLELADGARTLAAVSARVILRAAEHMPEPPKLWILCGGGRKNPLIVSDLRAGTDAAEVILAEDAGLNGDTVEAEAWAYLAVRALKGLPLTFPGTTGCREPVTGGILIHPRQNSHLALNFS